MLETLNQQNIRSFPDENYLDYLAQIRLYFEELSLRDFVTY